MSDLLTALVAVSTFVAVMTPATGAFFWAFHCMDRTANERHQIAMWIVSQRPRSFEDMSWRMNAISALNSVPYRSHWFRRLFIRDVRGLYPRMLQDAFDDLTGNPHVMTARSGWHMIEEGSFEFSLSPPRERDRNGNDGGLVH